MSSKLASMKLCLIKKKWRIGDADGAVKALTVDLSRLDGYTRQVEKYTTEQENYYQTVIKNINR